MQRLLAASISCQLLLVSATFIARRGGVPVGTTWRLDRRRKAHHVEENERTAPLHFPSAAGIDGLLARR